MDSYLSQDHTLVSADAVFVQQNGWVDDEGFIVAAGLDFVGRA